MKNLISFFLLSSIWAGYAQNKSLSSFDPTNAREGERVEYCHQHKKLAALMQNPAYVQQRMLDSIDEAHCATKPIEKGIVYKIPVVFHVLHNNGPENISDEQILDALSILNRDYRLLNQDANNVQPEFQGMPADIEVEFLLATKAPNGQCFKGITRTVNAITSNGADGGAQVDAIVAGNDVYNGAWPGNRYLNIFICAEIGGAAGYTTNPSGWSATQMTNGIWVLHDYVGSIGTSSVSSSRTLTHEVGHWLNLSHTWGSNNNPGNASSCSTDDNVQDTPNCIGVQACILSSNTCNSDNAYWGFDIKDNVENYMDYSYCSKMFTVGQKTRMRTALQSNNTGRANIVSQANLTLVGAGVAPYLCKADFSTDRTTICVGDQIQFSDESYNLVNSWSWSFPGGSPTSASTQNPTVTYNTPGLYSVTLDASDGGTNDSEVKSNYIRVLLPPTTIPFYEGFENYNSLSNLVNWEVYNPGGNNAFEVDNTTSFNGIKCAKVQNFGQPAGSVDELISTPIDLSGLTASETVTLSFRYAYRKKLAADNEALKVFITGDCGTNWVQRKTITNNQLSSIAVATSWKPTSQADWVTVHMTNVTSTYFQQNFRAKWRFEGNGGNNFYLDDINLYNGAPSNTVVLGMEALEENVSEVVLYPNPVSSELNIEYSATTADKMTVVLIDANGKRVQAHEIHSNAGKNLVMMDTHSLAAGKYSAVIYGSQGQISRTFIKQ